MEQLTTSPSSREELLAAVRRFVDIGGNVDEAASRLDVRPSTLRKILDGRLLSEPARRKLERRLIARDPARPTELNPSLRERLLRLHALYRELGTLEAVGRRMGLTRERVRQLLVKGTKLGVFEYRPYDYPIIEKDKLVTDYARFLSADRAAKANNISAQYLRKLLTAYGVSSKQLRGLRAQARKRHCVAQHRRIAQELGHPPTTTELQDTRAGHSLHMRINRLWGSIDAFREELQIPKPPAGNPKFRDNTRPWREQTRRLAVITRLQHLDDIRECLKDRPMNAAAIARYTRLNLNRVRMLVGLLVAGHEARRDGVGAATRYRLDRSSNA